MFFKRQQTPAPVPAPKSPFKRFFMEPIMEIGEFAEKSIAVGAMCGIPLKVILDHEGMKKELGNVKFQVDGMKKELGIVKAQIDKLVLTTTTIAETLVNLEKKIPGDRE